MEGSFNNRERRSYPRIVINLPLVYQEKDGSCLREGIAVNAGEGGFLIESTRDIPVGTELNVTVVFSKRKKVEVPFIDGEVLVGSSLGYDPKRPGFFIFPADPKSNNIRVYAVSSGVERVRYL